MTNRHLSSNYSYLDTLWQAGLARMTLGVSPAGATSAYFSWMSHLAQAPGKMAEIMTWPLLTAYDRTTASMAPKLKRNDTDPRFKSENWNFYPWRFYAEAFTMMEDWWEVATTGISGLEDETGRAVSFTARQMLDAFCPANFPVTNPDLAFDTFMSGGMNLVKGAKNAYEDMQRYLGSQGPAGEEAFKVGKNLALTPGQVVFRNDLIELIRYTPQTKSVYMEPVLIVPAWIMKYYILDLSPKNSLAAWLVKQGHTVYMVSWKNPDVKDRDLSMDDYYRRGAMAAVDAVAIESPGVKIHFTGYCLGGTLALITAAAMARDSDDRVKSLSLFAAQGDFTEAGELMLFGTHSEVSFLKNMMDVQGVLDTKQMAGAFQMLRSYDMIWSKIINDYMEGRRRDMIDLTAWNADATRLPARMEGEYLDKLMLHNDLAEGRFDVEGTPIAPENIHLPVFAVATERDHIAPWRSVHKIHLMVGNGVTFVLASGGHNAGIVSEPGHPGRYYYVREKRATDAYLGPDLWRDASEKKAGSWWESWHVWLIDHSSKEKISPPISKRNLGAAPGTYVFQK
jgi:polyhydroxyalkanoate synthase subunit PhaC